MLSIFFRPYWPPLRYSGIRLLIYFTSPSYRNIIISYPPCILSTLVFVPGFACCYPPSICARSMDYYSTFKKPKRVVSFLRPVPFLSRSSYPWLHPTGFIGFLFFLPFLYVSGDSPLSKTDPHLPSSFSRPFSAFGGRP